MQLFKFSLLLLILSMNSYSVEMFSDMECIEGNYDAVVEHKAAPFGLSKNILAVSKNDCSITISHSKLKFIKSEWTIDVCREPVHIKKEDGGVVVLKRELGCTSGSSEFCQELSKIEKILQDDGLIFAAGEKENISSDHGKVYCSYLLVKKYLRDGLVFNRGKTYVGALTPSQIEIIKIDEPIKTEDAVVVDKDMEADSESEDIAPSGENSLQESPQETLPIEDGPADF